MKIGIITGCWQRHGVLQAALDNWSELGAAEIIAAYTMADRASMKMLKANGCRIIEAPNLLATKFNAATRLAKQTDCDYFLHMGADDLIDPVLWDAYNRYVGDYMALTDWYFHHLPTNETRYWPGYVGPRQGEPIGAGKLVSREAMERIQWRPFIEGRNNALDHDQHHRLKGAGVKCDTFRLKDLGAVGVDLKDPANATPWSRIVPLTHREEHLSTLSPYLWDSINHL